jgi:hypothetical protein
VIAAIPAPAFAAGAPIAGFDVSPANPRVGDQIQLVSSSCDPAARLWSQDWDFSGSGLFGGATGPTASVTYATPGPHVVGLRVTSAQGDEATVWRTILVDTANAPARPQAARLVTPFPVVTLGGRLENGTTRVNLFSVHAPVCSRISVTCAGRGCPLKALTRFVGHSGRRLREVQRRFRAGNRLTVTVSRGGLIGKVTEFLMRRNKPPLRRDSCLLPGATTGSTCPAG